MSIKMMSRVWDTSRFDGTFLNALVALADWANEDGVCWYGVDKIAQRIRRKERQTQEILRKLMTSGELFILPGGGRRKTNTYLVCVGMRREDIVTALTSRFVGVSMAQAQHYAAEIESKRVRWTAPFCESETVQSGAQTVQFDGQKGAVATAPESYEPSIEPREPPNYNGADRAAGAAAPTDSTPSDGFKALKTSDATLSRSPRPLGRCPRSRPPARDPLLDHFAVIAYRDLTHLTPNDVQRQMMASHVTDEAIWRSKVSLWLASGWKKTNVAGMVQFYQAPAASPPTHASPGSSLGSSTRNASHTPPPIDGLTREQRLLQKMLRAEGQAHG